MGPERAEEFKAKNFGFGTSIKEISQLVGNKQSKSNTRTAASEAVSRGNGRGRNKLSMDDSQDLDIDDQDSTRFPDINSKINTPGGGSLM